MHPVIEPGDSFYPNSDAPASQWANMTHEAMINILEPIISKNA
jgi:hypothetical protein